MVPGLIILALWVALLAPGVVRWVRRHRPTTSIASFHRQLRGLEHSGPKLMEPAFRLEDSDEDEIDRAAALTAVPHLVLLPGGAITKEQTTMRHEDRYVDAHAYGDPYESREQVAPWDDPWDQPDPEPAYEPRTRRNRSRTVRAPRYDEYTEDDGYDEELEAIDEPVVALPAARAKARRTRIIAGLGAGVLVSFLLGLVPGLTILWVVTLVCVLALATYLALMYYASNAGMYGNDALARVTPVARSVVAPYEQQRAYKEDDDGWERRRVATARG